MPISKKNFIPLNSVNRHDMESNEGLLCVEIADSGEGIKLEEQSKLFQPFSQLSSNTGAIGTGLGLWISRHLIEIMKGKIKLYSIYGIGTAIRIYIPLQIETSQYFDLKEADKVQNSGNSRCSPTVPRHFTADKRNVINIKFVTDSSEMWNDLYNIPHLLQKEKINILISIHKFSDEIDFKSWNNNPIIIIICQRNHERLVEIILNIKKIEEDFNFPQFQIFLFKSLSII